MCMKKACASFPDKFSISHQRASAHRSPIGLNKSHSNPFAMSSTQMKLCSYSGYKIYPGHGKKMVKADGKVFTFLDSKCERSHLMKRNPRKITWTVLYRRLHKRTKEEEHTKKRSKRIVKSQRAIVGASLAEILAKRNQKPEVRKAQREQAERAAKEKKMKEKKAKAKERAPPPKVTAKLAKVQQKANKQPMSKAPRVGGKR